VEPNPTYVPVSSALCVRSASESSYQRVVFQEGYCVRRWFASTKDSPHAVRLPAAEQIWLPNRHQYLQHPILGSYKQTIKEV
jgi:hypothetical protein